MCKRHIQDSFMSLEKRECSCGIAKNCLLAFSLPAQKLKEIEEISPKSGISNPIPYSLTLLLLKIQ